MPDTSTRPWSGLPATFWALFVGVLLMSLATFVFPFLALFLRSRGYGVEQTGLLVALYGAGSIPAGPLSGWLADRFGRRPTLLGALLFSAALTAALPFLASPALVGAGTLVLGLAVHAYYPAANAVVSDVVAPPRYGDAFALMYWERNLGIALSFAVGGSLAAFGYERLFLVDAATTLLFALAVLLRVPETRPSQAAPRALAAAPRRGFAAVLADRPFCALMLLQTALLVGLFQFMVALPMAMQAEGLSAADYGRAMAVNGVLIALLSPFVSRLTARFDAGHVLAAAAVLVAAGYGAYAFCRGGLSYAAATAVWSLGEILTIPVVSSLVADLSPEDLRGRYQGVFSFSFGVAMTAAPALGGTVLSRLGATTLWAGDASLCLLLAAGHLAAGRSRRKAPAATPSGP